MHEPVPLREQLVRRSASSARTAPPARPSSGMLFPTDELIFSPSQESSSGVVSDDLRLEAVGLHDLAPGEQVVELVGAAELDVRLDRDRVVGLHERVEKLRDRDRLAARRSACAKSSRSRIRATVIVRARRTTSAYESFDEPLAVEAHLRPLGVEDRRSPGRSTASRSCRSPRRRGSAAPPSARRGRRSASCSRRRSARRCGPRPGRRACAGAGSPRPTWMSGEVTSIPSFTRSGRPSASFARAHPPGSTLTAFRVSSASTHARRV